MTAPDRRTLVYLAALLVGLGAVVGFGDAYVLRVASLVGI